MLYQEETKKAIINFPISGHCFSLNLAKNIALVKIAAAEANLCARKIKKPISQAIIKAGKMIINGQYNKEFVVDEIQGGAGTSMNMNVNEVIATLASKICKIKVHPLDHVNLSQSTNDVVPTALKITLLQFIDELIIEYQKYYQTTSNKAQEFKKIIKLGRTHLQDALPITLGQEFSTHAAAILEDIRRLKQIKIKLCEINLGGTAIGTGTNAPANFKKNTIKILRQKTGYPLKNHANLIYGTAYSDAYLELTGILNVLASNIIKFTNDLKLLASGPNGGFNEISFIPLQKGSSIMPGKVNPVMAEMWEQIAFQVIGNSQTIMLSAQAGQLELNVMLPIIAKNLFDSLKLLTNGVKQFTKLGLLNLKANAEGCQKNLEKSFALATYLCPKFGYDFVADLVKETQKRKITLKEILIEKKIMNEKEYKNWIKTILSQ